MRREMRQLAARTYLASDQPVRYVAQVIIGTYAVCGHVFIGAGRRLEVVVALDGRIAAHVRLRHLERVDGGQRRGRRIVSESW